MKSKNILMTCAALLLAAVTFESHAAPVSLQDARQSASRLFSSLAGSSLRKNVSSDAYSLALMRGSFDQPYYYVLNAPDDSGYVIVAGDDRLPEILAYADEGSFDTSGELPPNVAWWLSEYDKQIAWYYASPDLQNIDVKTMPMREGMRPISPLCTTRWNQTKPYYNLCPLSGTQRCVTGCVATAMAQVMKYHNWPVNPTGSANDVTFEGTTLNWANMLDDYVEGHYTTAQATAVATLMRQCGAAVSMQYSPYASGAYSADVQYAWTEYFDYNKDMTLEFRDAYSFMQWNSLVYNELANNRPVYYSGQAPEGGHAFVCDGFRGNGFFHFNWGWGGAYDGYFMLNALNPSGGGVGSYEGGYNSSQMIIAGVEPQKDAKGRQEILVATGGFSYQNGTFRVVDGPWYGNQQDNEFYNPHYYTITFVPGIKITGIDDTSVVTYSESKNGSVTLNQWYGIESINATVPSGLADGRYKITPAMKKQNGEWVDILPVYSKQTYVLLNVENGRNELTNPSLSERYYKLYLSEMEHVPGMKGSGPVVIRFYVTNVGNTDYSAPITLRLYLASAPDFSLDFPLLTMLPEKTVSIISLEKSVGLFGDCVAQLFDRDNNLIGERSLYLEELTEEEEDSWVNETPLGFGPVAPNFADTGSDYEIGFQIFNNELRDSYSSALKIHLCDYSDNVVMATTSEEVEFEPRMTTTLSTSPAPWTVEPGYYYWLITNADEEYLAGPWPLKLTSGEILKDGVSYYKYDAATKSAAVALGTVSYSGDVVVADEIEGYAVNHIDPGTFTFADRMKSLTLPAAIDALAPASLYDTSSLETLILRSDNPFPVDADVMPAERMKEVALQVPAGRANIYKRTQVWEEFFMPSWTVILEDGCVIESGMEKDSATGHFYAPYYVSGNEQLTLKVKSPGDAQVYLVYWLDGGEEKAFMVKDGKVTLPALGRSEGTFKLTTVPPASTPILEGAPDCQDVYSATGILLLKNATPAEIEALPRGLYIIGSRKVMK